MQTFADMPDAALLSRVIAHDPLAWNEFVRRFRPMVCHTIGKIIGRFRNAVQSDAFNEIYSEFYISILGRDMRRLRQYDCARGVPLANWLGIIARQTTYDFLRRRSREPQRENEKALEHAVASTQSAPAKIELSEDCRQLSSVLATFTPLERSFADLYFWQELEPDEIATRLKISVKTVYTKKHKLCAKLERALAA